MAPLSLRGSCCQRTTGASYIVYVLLCLSSRYWGEVPHEEQSLQTGGCSYVPIEGMIHLFFLVRWQIARSLSNGSSSTPMQSSMYFNSSLMYRTTPLPHLPCLSFLNSLYPLIAKLQSWEPFHHVSRIPTRSEPCIMFIAHTIHTILQALQRSVPPRHAELLEKVWSICLITVHCRHLLAYVSSGGDLV